MNLCGRAAVAGVVALAVGGTLGGSAPVVGVPPLPAGWSLVEVDGTDSLTLGSARDGVVTLWPDLADDREHLLWVYLHEVGHAYDMAKLTDADRRVWAAARGVSGVDWWAGPPGPVRYASDIPAEDFADAFAFCHLPRADLWRSTVAGPPDTAECTLLRGSLGL